MSFDPEQLEVLGIDEHLPPVSPDRFTAAALRERFAAPPVWEPEISVERRIGDRSPANAAVLVGLVLRDELTVLLTQRTDHLNDHPGQISFPGGRAEPEDADPTATALREAHEEIGLDGARVEVLGSLPRHATGTGFIVTPVVGLVRPGFELTIDPFEVAEAFEVPLAFLMNPRHHERRAIETGDTRREFLSMPWQDPGRIGAPRRYFIWGATAAMLRNLYRFLAA